MSTINTADKWQKTLSMIENEVNPTSFSTWFKGLKVHNATDDKLVLMADSGFIVTNLRQRYYTMLYNAVSMSFGKSLELEFVLREDVEKQTDNIASTMLNPNYTFDKFVVGQSNSFAYAASLAVSESPSDAYNPLFLYGGVGLGKTHLMNAIGNYILQDNPNMKILYISSETFTNELIDALVKKKGTSELRNKMRNVDVLIVDDIQFLSKTVATQEEFFHTFNHLHNAGKQIILSSDRPPRDIPTIEERLRSRFEWGLIVDIQKPDYETRIAILRKKAELEGIEVPDDVLNYIAERVDSNIRELEGALIRIKAKSDLMHCPITLEMAEETLKNLVMVRDVKRITPDRIMQMTADKYGISGDDMLSSRRSREIVRPRQIAMFLIRDMTELSFPDIGKQFGGRDHTTVMHACEKISSSLMQDTALNREVEELRKSIREG